MCPYVNMIGLSMLDVDFSISAALKTYAASFAALHVCKQYRILHERKINTNALHSFRFRNKIFPPNLIHFQLSPKKES